jgi:DNA-directed RNA polymerase specialized sigma24 family protein
VRRRRLEQAACERLGLETNGAAEPDESWLEGPNELLDDLPPAQAEAIRLRVGDVLEYADVARELGTTPAAARVRVHRGLTTLRNRLRERLETP